MKKWSYRVIIKVILVIILGIINIPVFILNYLSLRIFNKSLMFINNFITTELCVDKKQFEKDLGIETILNKWLLNLIEDALIFFILIALIVILIW